MSKKIKENISEEEETFDFDSIVSSKEKVIKNKKKIKARKNEGEYFSLPINDSDSELIVLVKQMLLDKKVNLKNINNFKDNMEMNNIKRGLRINSTISFARFLRIAEIFDMDVELKVSYLDSSGEDKTKTIEFKNKK